MKPILSLLTISLLSICLLSLVKDNPGHQSKDDAKNEFQHSTQLNNNGELPDGFLNVLDTKHFRTGNIHGQGYWTADKNDSYEIKKDGLHITALSATASENDQGNGAVLHRIFNEGIITLKVKQGSKFILSYHFQSVDKDRLALWCPDGKVIYLGKIIAGQRSDTIIFTSATLPKLIQQGDGFYLLKIALGPIHRKNVQKVWIFASDRKNMQNNHYSDNDNDDNNNFQDPDTNILMESPLETKVNTKIEDLQEGFIQIGSLSGTTIIKSIQLTDYNNQDNYLTRKALFIGNWFNTNQGRYPGTPALMSFTSGSEIRFKVKNTNSAAISFFLSPLEQKPYQPYVDLQYRDLTTHSTWSEWTRHQIPWTVGPNNSLVKLTDKLNKKHQYELRCCVDIYDSDSSWVYGIGAIVKDFQVDPGGKIWPSDISDKPVIMALGNSITAGVRQYLTKSGAIDQPANLLSYNSYFHIACDSLHAIPFNQAYGGTGIIRAWRGGGTPNAMTTLRFFKQGRKRTSIQPSVILLNEGTNDDPKNIAGFHIGYLQLLDTLHAFYPKAEMVLMIPYCQKFKETIREIGRSRQLKVVETSRWPLKFVDGVHPDSLSQRVAGDSLFHWIKNNTALQKPVNNSERK